jgi:putative inorganic carbon (HCO3(-)) transporter
MKNSNTNSLEFSIQKTIDISLIFLFAGLPLIINPTAFDYWYKPKAESLYALTAIIIIARLIQNLCLKKPVNLKSRPLTIPLTIYACLAVISTVFSVSYKLSLHGDRWRIENIFTLLSYVLLTLFFSSLVTSKKQIEGLFKTLFLTASLVALYGIIQYLGYNPTKHFIPLFRSDQIKSTIGNANFLGKFMVLVLPLFMAFYVKTKEKMQKLLFAIGTILCFCTLVLTFTRASWLGFCVSSAVFFVITPRKKFTDRKKLIRMFLLATIIFTAVSTLFFYNSNRVKLFDDIKQRIVSSFDTHGGMGVATRIFVWKKSMQLITERPFIGHGPDTQVRVMRKFNFEYASRFNNWVVLDRAHNNYIDIAITQGLAGLLSYLSVIIVFMLWLSNTIREEKKHPEKIVFSGIFAGFCGYLINDLFIFSNVSVSPLFWSLMGLTLAMKHADKQVL